jgi:hypothetical protein
MATTLYFRAAAASAAAIQTLKLDGTNGGFYPQALSTSRGTTATPVGGSTAAGPTDGVETGGSSQREWLSEPLAAAVTISGSITWNLRAYESSMSANVAINGIIEKLSGVDGAVTLIDKTTRTTELGTTEAAANFAETPAAGVSLAKGDRIRVRVFADDAGTMANGYNFYFMQDGPTAGASGDSYLTLTETLSFVSEPAGTTIYPTDTASAVSTASVDREAWTSRGAGVLTDVTNTATGPTSPIQVTDSAGGTVVDWFTKPLTAFTLSGAVRCNIREMVSDTTANVGICVQIARVAGDGTSPTVWGTSMGDIELGAIEGARSFLVAGDDLAISDGQRLRIRLLIDDNSNGNSAVMVSGYTATTYYASTGGASGDTWLTFTQTLTEYSSGTPKSASDSGTGSDVVSATAAALAGADSGAGGELTSAKVSATVEAGTGADTVVNIGIGVAVDSGTGLDQNAAVTVPISAVDSGLGSDTQTALAAALPVITDAGTGSDTRVGLGIAAADSGTGLDQNAAVTVPVVAVDSGVGADTALPVGLATADAGTGADSVASVGLYALDSGAAGELAAVDQGAAQKAGVDSGTGGDAHPAYGAFALEDAPSMYLRLGEPSGTFVDSSGSGLTVTETGTVTRDVADAGVNDDDGAISFPTTGDYLSVADNAAIDLGDGPFSIAFRVAVTSDSWRILLDKGTNGYRVWVDWHDASGFRIAFSKSPWTDLVWAANPLPFDGSWHEIVITRSGTGAGNTLVYIDGVEGHIDKDTTTALADTATALLIGPGAGGNAASSIDEVAIYKSVLSPYRIERRYRQSVALVARGADKSALDSGLGGGDPRYSALVREDAPSLYLRLGEGSGSFNDSSGNGLTVTEGGTVTRDQADALVNDDDGAVAFPTIDDYLTVADDTAIDIGNTFSIEFWARFNAGASSFRCVLNKVAPSYSVFTEWIDAFPTLWLGGGAWDVATSSWEVPFDGTWHHYVITRNGVGAGNALLYLDGVEGHIDKTPSTSLADNASDLVIGRMNGSIGALDGALDELAIYKGIVLTPERIERHYRQSAAYVAQRYDKSATDSGTGADVVSAKATATTDAATGGDVVSGSTNVGDVALDSGTGVDTATVATEDFKNAVDSATASDIATLAVVLPVSTDSGTGVDTATIRIAAVDAGVGSDISTALANVTDVLTDSGVGADVSTGIALGIVTDAGTGLDQNAAVAVPISALDAGSGVDVSSALTNVTDIATDAGTAGELASVEGPPVQKFAADGGAGVDTATLITAMYLSSDSGVGQELAAITAAYLATDSGVATDGPSNIGIATTDAGVGADAIATLAALISGVDSGDGFDIATLTRPMALRGVTRDAVGNVLPNCVVKAYRTSDDVMVGEVTSSGAGVYSVDVATGVDHYLVAYLDGTPDVAGTTVNTLQGT